MFSNTKSRLRLVAKLVRNESGVALVELAITFPVLMIACMGGLELSNMAMAYMRVNNIAVKTADNAARVRTSIDEADFKEIFLGAKLMGEDINFASNGRIILSIIEPVMDASTPPQVVNQRITWQRCYGAHAANSSHGAAGALSPTGFGLSTKPQKITAGKNTAVMLAEVVYTYQPLISSRWYGPQTMRVAQSITVRERSDQVIKNGTPLTTAQQALCSNTHAA